MTNNPGPANSSTVNTTPLSVSTDINGKVQNIYGAGQGPVDMYSLSKAMASPVIAEIQSISTGVAPSGSVAANGALTLGTALDGIYGPTGISPGIWLYFPQGAVYPGSIAGLYWCVMTSTTLGTIYNTIYVPPGAADAPSSPTPIINIGPGNYTGVTTEVAVSGFVIKGGSLGNNGSIQLSGMESFINNANAKTGRIRFGGISGTAFETISGANNATSFQLTYITNAGGPGFQVSSPALAFGLSTSAAITSTIDTTQDQSIINTVQLGTATDWFIFKFQHIEILQS